MANFVDRPRTYTYEDIETLESYKKQGSYAFAGSTFFIFQIKEVDKFVKRKLRNYISRKKKGPNGFTRYTIDTSLLSNICSVYKKVLPKFVEIVTWGKSLGAIICTSYLSFDKETGGFPQNLDSFFREPFFVYDGSVSTAVASLANIMISKKLSRKRLFSEITFIGCENDSYVTRTFTKKDKWYRGSLTNKNRPAYSKEENKPTSEAGFSGFAFVMSIPITPDEVRPYEKFYHPMIFLTIRKYIDGHLPREGVNIEDKYISLPRANCQTLHASFLYNIREENYEEYLFTFLEATFRKVDCFMAGEKFVNIMRNKTPMPKQLEKELEDYNRELKLLRNDTCKNVSTASPKDLVVSWYQNTGTKEFVDNLEIISNYLIEETNQKRENKRQLLLNFIGVFAIISAVWDFVSLWINPTPDGHKIGSILIGIIFIFVLIVFR